MPKKKRLPEVECNPALIPVNRFALPEGSFGWFQLSEVTFKKQLIPYLAEEAVMRDEAPVIFTCDLGKFTIVVLGSLTVVFATFSQNDAARS